jgi:L-fuculokinase
MNRPRVTAVFDVGKSTVRLCATDDRGVAMLSLERPNLVRLGPPYPHFDVDDLFAWLMRGLTEIAREFEVHSIVPVSHGACAALIKDEQLALPVLDYEFDGVGEIDSEYESIARDFAHTASPRLPAGLNLGRQLFWQHRNYPAEFSLAIIIPYPQYWAWRLCGVRAWEATSLGCHTDLWAPREDDFSAFAKATGWDSRFGSRVSAWTALGPPRAEILSATGLSPTCAVLAGIHDSNASYLAHRATREDPFCVVSTGTWIVMMAHRGSLDALDPRRDTLANVDAFGNPVPTARFMGGREYAAICGEDALRTNPLVEDLQAVLASGTLAIPSFSDQGGPFPACAGKIEGRVPAMPRQRAALAAMYCALMTDYCLDMLDARGDIIVEGQFAANEAFASALAGLRAPQPVLRSFDETGTLRGGAILSLLARGKHPEPAALSRFPSGPRAELETARRRWRSLIPAID